MAALKASDKSYEMFIYPGTQHGFHNNSTPRYNEAQGKITWDRAMAFLKKNLGLVSTARSHRLHAPLLAGEVG